ncbi:MAG: hypothetical protein ABH878_01380, partial [bacterium]
MKSSIVTTRKIRSQGDSRIDSEFYQPQYLDIERHLGSLRSYRLGTLSELYDGPFGSVLHADEYVITGFPVLHLQNISESL